MTFTLCLFLGNRVWIAQLGSRRLRTRRRSFVGQTQERPPGFRRMVPIWRVAPNRPIGPSAHRPIGSSRPEGLRQAAKVRLFPRNVAERLLIVKRNSGCQAECGVTVSVDINEVWREYRATGSTELRNRLVMQYAPLVKYVAGRVRSGLPQTVDPNDLVSEGVFGLMDAIEKFDLSRGLAFQTYALPRIKGAMIDAL